MNSNLLLKQQQQHQQQETFEANKLKKLLLISKQQQYKNTQSSSQIINEGKNQQPQFDECSLLLVEKNEDLVDNYNKCVNEPSQFYYPQEQQQQQQPHDYIYQAKLVNYYETTTTNNKLTPIKYSNNNTRFTPIEKYKFNKQHSEEEKQQQELNHQQQTHVLYNLYQNSNHSSDINLYNANEDISYSKQLEQDEVELIEVKENNNNNIKMPSIETTTIIATNSSSPSSLSWLPKKNFNKLIYNEKNFNCYNTSINCNSNNEFYINNKPTTTTTLDTNVTQRYLNQYQTQHQKQQVEFDNKKNLNNYYQEIGVNNIDGASYNNSYKSIYSVPQTCLNDRNIRNYVSSNNNNNNTIKYSKYDLNEKLITNTRYITLTSNGCGSAASISTGSSPLSSTSISPSISSSTNGRIVHTTQQVNTTPTTTSSTNASSSSLLTKFTTTFTTNMQKSNNLMNNIANKTTQLFNRNRTKSNSNETNSPNAIQLNTNQNISSRTSSLSSSASSTVSSSVTSSTNSATSSPTSLSVNSNSIFSPLFNLNSKYFSSSSNSNNEFNSSCGKTWFFDENENYWYTINNNESTSINKYDKLTTITRTPLASSSAAAAGGSVLNSNRTIIKLTRIDIKYLTILELNYLKQICLFKFQQIITNTSLSIPKDESIKCIKQSHFAIRSKSVDYKLAIDDDIDKLKAQVQAKEQTNFIFGQSLYKCILNDIFKRKNQNNSSNNHDDNHLIKRNSVLFEALDLPSKTSILSATLINHHYHQNNNNKESKSDITSNGINCLVPNIVKQCCNHIENHGLNIVGIFRIDSSKKRIKEIRDAFDSGQLVSFDSSYNPLDVACLLKEYLRSLPEPLLTRKLYASFIACSKLSDSSKKLEAIRCLICLLPVPNRDTLQMLLKLLDKLRSNCNDNIVKQKCGNKMDAFNLAMIFGPNILQKRKQLSNKEYLIDKYSLIDDIESVISITKYLIENQNYLFYIENTLHNELVKKVYDNNPNEFNSILTRKLAKSIGIEIIGSMDNHLNNNDSSGYSSSVTTRNNTDESSSSSDLCQSSNELDKLTINPVSTGANVARNYSYSIKCATSPNNQQTSNNPTPSQYFTIQNAKAFNKKLSLLANNTNKIPQQETSASLNMNNKTTTNTRTSLAANRNVYVKNRAYFPISHMNKNLINNLNEENLNKQMSKPKNSLQPTVTSSLSTFTKSASSPRTPTISTTEPKTTISASSLLMIQHQQQQKRENENKFQISKAKSLTNLYHTMDENCKASKYDYKRIYPDKIHFIGEQETLV